MAPIKFSEILSYSSEDENNPVTALLTSNGSRKWKCKSGLSEKQHHVILKFDKLSCITSIDIGNEHSAFVEVLVGREGVDFQVLLVASSFMTPLESRNSTNVNRVRMFGEEKLSKLVLEQKWDRIKVICTQPFNKNVQYGLSFIVAHGKTIDSNDIKNVEMKKEVETKIGKFILKESSDSSEDSASGNSLFSAMKGNNASLSSMAASIRAASTSLKISEEELKTNKRKADDISDNNQFKRIKSDMKDSHKANSPSSTIKQSHHLKIDKIETPIKGKDKTETPKIKVEASDSRDKKDSLKGKQSQPKQNIPEKDNSTLVTKNVKSSKDNGPTRKSSKSVQSRPFNKLMNDVIFCLSGFQNPKRSQLRDKLIKMGAKYMGDWGKTCTHLICAFANTPKFQSVRGKGKIVKESWVEDCHQNKKRFPWRRYNMEKNRNADESEEEIWASELIKNDESEVRRKLDSSYNDDDSEDTDTEIQNALKSQNDNGFGPSNSNQKKESDKENKLSNLKCEVDSDIEYDMDTDVDEEETVSTNKKSLPELACYFEKKSFYLYGFTNKMKEKSLQRYIIAYKGTISNYMAKTTNYVITDGPWDENFDDALDNNPSLQFIKPQWVWKCCDKQKLVPCQPFLVSCIDT